LEDANGCGVDGVVVQVTLVVFESVLTSGDGQDDDERKRGQSRRDVGELREELQDDED
jgi:hypothetical protein